MTGSQRNNIILIGFMGCGKSSVGKRLAGKIAYSFNDTDNLIEQKEKDTISNIFKKKGEEYFRNLETCLLMDLSETLNNTILSTGGGMPMREPNGRLLRELGFVIYLKTSKNTILNRLKNDRTRPLLQGDNPEDKVGQLLSIREPVYERTAHEVIVTDNKTPDQIADDILWAFKEEFSI